MAVDPFSTSQHDFNHQDHFVHYARWPNRKEKLLFEERSFLIWTLKRVDMFSLPGWVDIDLKISGFCVL